MKSNYLSLAPFSLPLIILLHPSFFRLRSGHSSLLLRAPTNNSSRQQSSFVHSLVVPISFSSSPALLAAMLELLKNASLMLCELIWSAFFFTIPIPSLRTRSSSTRKKRRKRELTFRESSSPGSVLRERATRQYTCKWNGKTVLAFRWDEK